MYIYSYLYFTIYSFFNNHLLIKFSFLIIHVHWLLNLHKFQHKGCIYNNMCSIKHLIYIFRCMHIIVVFLIIKQHILITKYTYFTLFMLPFC